MVGVIHSSCVFFPLRVAFGNCNGLAVVDFIQKTVLLSMGPLTCIDQVTYITNDNHGLL